MGPVDHWIRLLATPSLRSPFGQHGTACVTPLCGIPAAALAGFSFCVVFSVRRPAKYAI